VTALTFSNTDHAAYGISATALRSIRASASPHRRRATGSISSGPLGLDGIPARNPAVLFHPTARHQNRIAMATRWHGICHDVVAAQPQRMRHWTCILDPSIDRLHQEVLTTVRRRSRYLPT
jgi:thioesterase domain-containing protein